MGKIDQYKTMNKNKTLNNKIIYLSIILSVIFLFLSYLYWNKTHYLLGEWQEVSTLFTQIDPNYTKATLIFSPGTMQFAKKEIQVEYQYKENPAGVLIISNGWILKVKLFENNEIYMVFPDGRPRRFKKIK